MWLFFDGGFVSIVENRLSSSVPLTLLVRARAREDLRKFCRFCGAVGKITESPSRDYRFRVNMTRAVVARGIAKLAMNIDYSNFKDQVRASQGAERAHIYGEIWLAGLQIDDRRRKP